MALVPVVDADAALVEVAVQKPDTFWTLCDKCGLKLEYEIKYLNLSILCPLCSEPFMANGIPLKYSNNGASSTMKSVRRAPKRKRNIGVAYKDEVVSKNLEVHQPTVIVSVPESFQPIGGDAAVMQSGDKTKDQELIKPPGADYKDAQDECGMEMPLVPQEIRKEASPEDVVEELQTIEDLTSQEFLKAYNILRRDDFQFRSLKALPMELKKEWLLEEMKGN
ncbi:hypothetical protein BS78_08G110300 [Paspalum vaginatum]|nr:hypothetical protein BS78_08G110300 [Paspalum vaginatum]